MLTLDGTFILLVLNILSFYICLVQEIYTIYRKTDQSRGFEFVTENNERSSESGLEVQHYVNLYVINHIRSLCTKEHNHKQFTI